MHTVRHKYKLCYHRHHVQTYVTTSTLCTHLYRHGSELIQRPCISNQITNIVNVVDVKLLKVVDNSNEDTFFVLKGVFTKHTPILRI